MFIHRLLYCSDAALAGPPEDVERQVLEMVEAARAANAAADITGAILLSSGVFMQVLEGPIDAVETTFERICSDLRHKRVRLIELAVAEDRVFEGWSMVRVPPPPEAARLCPAPGAVEGARLDAASASAAIQMLSAAAGKLLAGDGLEPVGHGTASTNPAEPRAPRWANSMPITEDYGCIRQPEIA